MKTLILLLAIIVMALYLPYMIIMLPYYAIKGKMWNFDVYWWINEQFYK